MNASVEKLSQLYPVLKLENKAHSFPLVYCTLALVAKERTDN